MLLAVALNLSGVFEIGASLQGLGGGLAPRAADLVGAVFTGALAVVVAAPCTAPFMGPALGYALTQPALPALAVFAALALGFAAPFTAAGLHARRCSRRLPKPGRLDGRAEEGAGVPDVRRRGLAGLGAGRAGRPRQPRRRARRRRAGRASPPGSSARPSAARRRPAARWTGSPLAGLAAALAVAAVAAAPYGRRRARRAPSAIAAGIPSEPWSPERVAALRAAGKPVFVDFTAAWCVTCQVNEQVALNTAEAVEAFQRTGAVYLKADWTNRDAAIAKALADQGRVGVPLYLVYGAGGGAPKVLPQLLTSGMVAAALDAARSPHP